MLLWLYVERWYISLCYGERRAGSRGKVENRGGRLLSREGKGIKGRGENIHEGLDGGGGGKDSRGTLMVSNHRGDCYLNLCKL